MVEIMEMEMTEMMMEMMEMGMGWDGDMDGMEWR